MDSTMTTPPPSTSGRRRFGAGTLVIALLAGLGLGGGATAVALRGRGGHDHEHAADGGKPQAEAKDLYVCPMHPTITSDHPGDCPICGMKLVKAAAPPPGKTSAGPRKIAFYRSPMDSKQTSPTPRKDGMGMDYLPVYEDEARSDGAPVEGLATVQIDPQRQQLIGLKTAAVTRGSVGAAWRTVGKVAVDETRVHHVNIKVSGFAEQVFVDYVGKYVKRGDPLFTIYSPDLLSVQQEYLLALRTRKALAGGGVAGDPGDELVRSARQRLELWDIPDSEVARLERTGKPTKTLTLYSPMSGVVTKKDLVMGHRLNEGDMPYEITDLS
ncbi:MAG TPA: efflux RND transporter periplasmic adaptor subunit, partial [Anaeromyxobacteraceae bacterium]